MSRRSSTNGWTSYEVIDLVRNKEEIEQEIEELKERIADLEKGEDTEKYDEYLDEVNGDVRIGSLTYSASRVLKEVDEIAYRCGYSDWSDAEITELEDQLDELEQELKEAEG